MPKQIPWHLQEIFGASTVEESLDATTPVTRAAPAAIPVLDTAPALRDFQKSAGAADQIVQKIELQELTDTLCPIPLEVLAERDAERFSPTQSKPGLEFVKTVLDGQRFTEEILPSASTLGEWAPAASQMFGSLIKTAQSSRRRTVDRQDISKVMSRYYSHGLWKRWEAMMSTFIGDSSFTEEKGLAFLKAGAL